MFAKVRPYILSTIAIISILPGILISEPSKVAIITNEKNPVEILTTSFMFVDAGNSVLFKIAASDLGSLTSLCKHTQTAISTDENIVVVEWKPRGKCRLPLITLKGKNYLLPLRGSRLNMETLSDISSDTLRNTLTASRLLNLDFKTQNFSTRQFLSDMQSILDARKEKFVFPITGIELPTKNTYLPNSSRPYRGDVTDAIHHGWDFYTQEGTPVRAIEDGIIIHVKRDFSWDEMNNLHSGGTDLEEQENLDTYRGNTVYLKTRSGHVGIYAHLQNIPDNIQIGTEVSQGEIVGHVGDSAVPDKKYLYHLHFELAVNPLIDTNAGTNTFDDVLLWPFWGKNKSFDWIRQNGGNLFE